MYIDSHTHLYLEAFEEDRDQVVERALESGVETMLLPNIDSSSAAAMLDLCRKYPANCFPMAGLHPGSVKDDYKKELAEAKKLLEVPGIVGIGESGMDLYWSKAHLREQVIVFKTQIEWAKARQLPIVIHARESFPEIFRALEEAGVEGLSGVFHSFTGGRQELEKALGLGFMVGINGICTYKNAGLKEVLDLIPLDRLLLETDSPFLAPVPHRGKRNESSYLPLVAAQIAAVHGKKAEEIGRITSDNARQLFSLD